MLKIMKISDMDSFMEKIRNCRGEVNLHLPDGSTCDLKSDHTAAQILTMIHSINQEIDISLTDPRDCVPLMNFMMSAAA